MTEGIDINSGQADISISTAKSQHVEFVVVKMGGANVLPIYVAPHYTAQIDRCIAANMPKGHYWAIGDWAAAGQPTIIDQADYFVNHLHKFDKTRDILAIDNEIFPGENSYLWQDSSIAAFINHVKFKLGIGGSQFWAYASTSVWRDSSVGPWTDTIKTGCRFWVANWGANDGTRVAPELGGSIPSVDVQQYYSKATVAGVNPVDRNYSKRTLTDLFGSWAADNGGGTGTGTGTGQTGNALSDQDRADLGASIPNILGSKADEIGLETWKHQVASAIDGGKHIVQTYAAWEQRDLQALQTFLTADDPAFILAKESSSNVVFALNPQKGTKRALTANQFNVLQVMSVNFKVVPDGSLAAFGTDNRPPVASFHSVTNNSVVTFDGSASSDSDGTIVSYSWDFGDGRTGTGQTTSHTYVNGQTYTATLTVTDNSGATALMTKSVPIGTTLTLAADATVASGSTVTVTPLPGVDYSTATYTQTFGPPVILTGSDFSSRTFIAPAAGSTVDISVKGFAQSGQNVSETQYEFTVN